MVSDRAGLCCTHEERLRRVVQNEVAFLRMAVQELRRLAQEIPQIDARLSQVAHQIEAEANGLSQEIS